MLETILALTWLGWSAISFLCLLTFIAVARESWGFSTLAVILTAITFYYFFPALLPAGSSLWWYILVYIGLGIVWSFWKWYQYLIVRKESYDSDVEYAKANQDPKRRGGAMEIPKIEDYMPTAGRNKARLSAWMAFWPWSVLWAITHDLIKNFYNWLVRLFGRIYDGMARKVFKA